MKRESYHSRSHLSTIREAGQIVNLYTGGWIKVSDAPGVVSSMSPRQILQYPDCTTTIVTQSIPEEIGIYRFLASIIIDAGANLSSYDADGLDLRSFMQTHDPTMAEKKAEGMARLSPGLKSGTNTFLHDTHRNEPHHWCTVCVSTAIVSLSATCPSGGGGYGPTVNSGSPFYLLPRGETVSERASRIAGEAIARNPNMPIGIPSWRLGESPSPKGVHPAKSILRHLTYMPRRIKLGTPHSSGDMRCTRCGIVTETLYREMAFAGGSRPGPARDSEIVDPMCVYRESGVPVAPYPVGGVDIIDWASRAANLFSDDSINKPSFYNDSPFLYCVVADKSAIREQFKTQL